MNKEIEPNDEFVNLTVRSLHRITSHGERVWRTECDCGEFRNVRTGDLNSGAVKRCVECSQLELRRHRRMIGGRNYKEAAKGAAEKNRKGIQVPM